MNIKNLTLSEKIGQMLCFAFHGTSYNEQLKLLIEELNIGNIIYFGRNIVDLKQTKDLNKTIRAKAKYPLFIGLDQEGGMVRRISKEITYLPGAMSLAAAGGNVYEITNRVALDLKSLGFNINYAPVADINNNPNNPVINSRSYGDEPKTVSKSVIKAYRAMQDAFLLPTIKHFPGHGDTSVDSHIGLPVVDKDLDALKKLELIPFVDAINSGVDGIMVSHILYSKLDEIYPSSLSRNILTKLLKEELGFKGLITTDSLTMGAIWDKFSIEEIVEKGVDAGNDILVFCGPATIKMQKEIVSTFHKLVSEGKISMMRIDESVQKIISLKAKYNKSNNKSYPLDDLSEELVAKSITKVSDNSLLPIKKEDKVLIISPELKLETLTKPSGEYFTLGDFLEYEEIMINEKNNKRELIDKIKHKYDKIIMATYNVSKGDYQQQIFKLLDKEKVINIALRSPYDINVLASKTYICTYDYSPESLRALSRKLFSNDFVGKLPIKLQGGKNESN